MEVSNSNAVGRIRKKPRTNRNLEKVNKDGLNSISWVITVRWVAWLCLTQYYCKGMYFRFRPLEKLLLPIWRIFRRRENYFSRLSLYCSTKESFAGLVGGMTLKCELNVYGQMYFIFLRLGRVAQCTLQRGREIHSLKEIQEYREASGCLLQNIILLIIILLNYLLIRRTILVILPTEFFFWIAVFSLKMISHAITRQHQARTRY